MSQVRGDSLVISASSVKSASGNVILQLPSPDQVTFILNVTASSSPTTLDLYLQTSPNLGTTWYDFAHFTQVGAVSTNIQALQWCRFATAANNDTSVIVTGDAALAAAKVINGPIVDAYVKAKWVIAGTSYTFSILAILDRN